MTLISCFWFDTATGAATPAGGADDEGFGDLETFMGGMAQVGNEFLGVGHGSRSLYRFVTE